MKLAAGLAIIAWVFVGLLQSPPAADVTLIFSGDLHGYLSPCGCSKPQIGGLLRMSSAVRALQKMPNSFFVETGNWTKVAGRQDELKADAIAEVLRELKPVYLNIGLAETKIPTPNLEALAESVGGQFGSSNFSAEISAQRRYSDFGTNLRVLGAVNVGDVFGGIEANLSAKRQNVLLLSGSLELAKSIANRFSSISLIIFSSQGDATKSPLKVKNCLLISLADKGKYVGSIQLVKGKWTNFRLHQLGPEYADDPAASGAYKSYLHRVTSEKLLDALPRRDPAVAFSGSQSCVSCHEAEAKVWKSSAHARALATLEKTGNDRDPECVSCHVVGLDFNTGFADRVKTPALTDVGCESCHGAGTAHVLEPKIKMGKVGEKSCAPCHVPDHSPGFDFKTYWTKIAH